MAMDMAKPQREHVFLERLVGRWEVIAPEMTDGEPWTEICRSLHGIWFVAEGSGRMPGGAPAATVLTLGYDPSKGRYVGSWIGSMMTHMWVYEGELSDDGATLSLYTSGPDLAEPAKTCTYREQISFIDDEHRVFRSSAKQPDGAWKQFMQADYRRQR